MTMYPLYRLDPAKFSIRLVGGHQSNEGRVQMFYNNQWGSVCSHEWDFNDARVTCRQLGYVDALTAVTTPQYGNRTYKEVSVVNNVRCHGNEPGLDFCDNVGFGNANCKANETAGVICTGINGWMDRKMDKWTVCFIYIHLYR